MTSAPGRFRIRLAKEDFKFSAAHFTLFGGDRAETLHGHNYRVRVWVEGGELDERGLLLDLDQLKSVLRATCRRLDGRLVLPADNELLTLERGDGTLVIRFAARRYEVPAEEIVALPIANTSMELLARWIWSQLVAAGVTGRADRLAVEVEETPGQGCRFEAPVEPT